MRIAFIATSKIPSRTANSIQVMKVCQAFRELGHDIGLWVPGPSSEVDWHGLAAQYGLQERFPIHWLSTVNLLRRYDFALRAVRAARRWGAEFFYTWPLQAAALASTLGFPTLLEMHDRPHGRFGPWLFKAFLRGSGALRVYPITSALETWLSEAYRVDLNEPFSVVSPMGVDLYQYEQLPGPVEARDRLDLENRFTAGYTGHLYRGRGINLLYELARQLKDVNFLLVGGEDESVDFWRRKAEADGVENLQLQGFVDNAMLPMYHAACDVLMMPYERAISVSSGGDTAAFASPMKVFEYLAAGRAIISSDLAVLHEVLNDQNAIMVPPEDLDAWSQALGTLVADPSLRTRLAERAKADSKKYTWLERAKRSIMDVKV
ncbi:MAG: glycosyltransferase [Anaerolineales bacterium]|nr:glycosyltransferase [Anaerolineales bacterium]